MALQERRLSRFKGIKDIIRLNARCSWPVNYQDAYKTIHDSTESLCYETLDTWHQGREFDIW